LESILDFLSDTFVNSVFPEEEFQKEKGVIIEEIRMYEDQPRAQAEDLLMEVLYGDQPAGWNIAGTEKNILNMTRSQMVEFYKKYYHPKNAVLFVMGNFDKIKTKKLIKKYFGFEVKTKAISFPKAKMVFDGPKVNLKTKDVKETHFVLGFNAFKLYDKRNAVVSVINGILSSGFNSRLYLNVREKLGGAYYVHSGVDKLYDRGIFEVSAGVNTGKTEMILKEIIKELQKLKTEAVEEKELDKVKNRIIGSILM
jgi:predicted Zn-dependent peptidase